MSENIDNSDLFASGGHVWVWGDQPIADKVLTTVAIEGAARMVLVAGPIPGVIDGRDGQGAWLIGKGADRAAAHVELDTAEKAIEALARSGEAKAWEDDQGHTGQHLVITRYQRIGRRTEAAVGDSCEVWQRYRCMVLDLSPGDRR